MCFPLAAIVPAVMGAMSSIGSALGVTAAGAAAGGAAAGVGVGASAAAFSAAGLGSAALAFPSAMVLPAAAAGLSYTAAAPLVYGGLAAAGTGFSAMKAISAGLSLTSTIGSGVAQYQGSRAQSSAMRAAAAMDRLRAADARERGTEESDRRRLAASRMIGEQKARAAAAGVDPNTGSALDLIDDSWLIAEDDAFRIRRNAEREAQGYAVAAETGDVQAVGARRQGLFDVGGTVLTGASRVADRWRAWRQPTGYSY